LQIVNLTVISRKAYPELIRLAKQYPVVTVVGPRQSGKTTLCTKAFDNYPYFSLEDPDHRQFAKQDPKSFLHRVGEKAIIDEIQNAPELLSYIQTDVDRIKGNGRYILTGSQQFELMAKVSQSLAGRTAIVRLLPLTIAELNSYENTYRSVEDYLYSGFYPRIFDQSLNATEAYSFYVSTYLERDIRSLINVKDYLLFERFIKICASRSGQIFNATSIANECGVSHTTVTSWIALLEASFVLFRLPPHYKNFAKRLVKSPKLYFYDVGLASYLIGIQRPEHWGNHPLKGAFFETMVVGELIKNRFNSIRGNNLFYFRDNIGHEVDVLIDEGTYCTPVEIKLSSTINEEFFKDLRLYQRLQNVDAARSTLIYGGDESYDRGDTTIRSFKHIDF
jgi:uncharacterized protein